MQSIKDIYVIGHGPSSSHTMGPAFASKYIIDKYVDIKEVKVVLYGSLALTGKGHLTDYIIEKTFNEHKIPVKIFFNYTKEVNHPNTMEFLIKTSNGEFKEEIVSLGGGTILTKDSCFFRNEIYEFSTLTDILRYIKKRNMSIYEYALSIEGGSIISYLKDVLNTMDKCVEDGLNKEGVLPGRLKVKRKAKEIYEKSLKEGNPFIKEQLFIMSHAYAASEENAAGGVVSTAPTCGSCGVIPGVIAYLRKNSVSNERIIESLLVGGLIGKIVKTNASVSGAVAGCQAEIGTATAMGAAMIMHAFHLSNENIAQASEIALEHSLGLTCDPIQGYVQIPCIERNAIFALKAINSASLAMSISSKASKINFDQIVHTMYETGIDLQKGYRETSEKGMSKIKITK